MSPSVLSQLTTLKIRGHSYVERMALNKKCPNLTSLLCIEKDELYRIENNFSSLPKSLTRLMLPTYTLESVHKYWDTRGEIDSTPSILCELPALTECNLLSTHIDPNLRRLMYTPLSEEEADVTITSDVLEWIDLDYNYIGDYSPVLHFHCPRLTTLHMPEFNITSETMENILACPLLADINVDNIDDEALPLLKRLKHLKALVYSTDRLVNAVDLPQSLTHLTVLNYDQAFVSDSSLSNLLVLICWKLRGELPVSLRKLVCRGQFNSSIKNVPLVSLELGYTAGIGREFPETLTKLKLSDIVRGCTIIPVLPISLPVRLRKLVIKNHVSTVPKSWSFSHLQYFRSTAVISIKQREELRGRTFILQYEH